ncbi:two-component regulator propeller domain-containing protein [Postechiella marina]|uniref:histidine kinase n=2 Tax=Postechiella marina TaxID=943941 RepID=A0ABP8CD66_9FLAO
MHHIYKVIFLFFCLPLFSQEKALNYSQQLTISEGLAHNGVTSIFEDSKGFIWVGTYDGLNKYDGYSFKIFKNTLEEDLLTSNRVRDIEEDKKGNLWIGTDAGITIRNCSTDTFKKIYSEKINNTGISGPVIRKIIVNKDANSILCISERKGLFIFNENYELEKRIKMPFTLISAGVSLYDGVKIDKNNFVFASSRGLVHYNDITGNFDFVLRNKTNGIITTNSICTVNKNTLLVTLKSGVGFISFKKDKSNKLKFKLKSVQLLDYEFKNARVDYKNNLWLAHLHKGISVIQSIKTELDNKELVLDKTLELNTAALRASCFEISKNSGCWAGTFNKGIYRFDLNENPFKSFDVGKANKFGVRTSTVTSVSMYDKDCVFVSVSRGGASLYNTKTKAFEDLPFNISNDERLRTSSMFVDSNKNIWIKFVSDGNLYRVKSGTKTIKKVEFENGELNVSGNFRCITEDKQGNLFLGTDKELYKVVVNNNQNVLKFEKLSNNPFFKGKEIALLRCVYVDPLYDFLWIGDDDDGLYRLKMAGNKPLSKLKIDHYYKDASKPLSISSNFVTSIVRLPNEELWVGTERGGVCKVVNSDTEPEFIAFSEKKGLSNNVVKSIVYDNEYNLWISTNIGLNKLNTKDFSIRKFNKEDGLPFEDFWYAADRLPNGYIFLSGLDGFCYFKPEDLNEAEALPAIEFGDFKVFNKTIKPNDTLGNRVLFNKHISNKSTVDLKHNENVFSVEVTSLHFSNPSNHHLKYKLSPIDGNYINVPSNQKQIQYNGLQPGRYILSVMASNSINEWTEAKELIINIKTPYWKTGWAYFIYFLLACLIIYLAFSIIIKIQKLNHKVEIEQLEINNVRHINAEKLRFFSNISHDIKTPLTLISGPVDALLNQIKPNSEYKEKLEIVKRQSKKISQLIDQVHDFQRTDAEVLKMNYTHFYFNDFIEEIISDFSFMASTEGKTLEIKSKVGNVYVSADKILLEKVFNNVLNNAFKYTNTGDVITVNYGLEDKDLLVSISDTGKGIDAHDLPHVFERFYQTHKKNNVYSGGSGIGLAFSKRLVEMHYGYIDIESEIGIGTTLNLRLPIVKKTPIQDEESLTEKGLLKAEKEHESNTLLINNDNIDFVKVDESFAESVIFYAEDNVDMRLFVSQTLSKFFKVKIFSNGQELIDAMEDEWPDIIISDLLMPELNGLELCKLVKSDVKTSHIPIVLLTACATNDDRIQGLRDGADAYIKKPFNMEHLVTRTEALLLNRKQLSERFKIGIPLTKENNKNNRNDNAFLEKLYNLMSDNLDNQELDINDLAKQLYLNRTHFYQKVKVLTNHTPFELLKDFRLKKAAEFLVEKRLTVNEVFVVTGFKSRSHFSKLFKDKYNITPGKFAADRHSRV